MKTSLLCITFSVLVVSCSSAPKKSEHALADLLLNKHPRIGVPTASSHPEQGETEDSAQLMQAENEQERVRNHNSDQAEFENRIREFRAKFMDLMREKNKILEAYSGDARVQELERVSVDADALLDRLSQYAQHPGTLEFYREGEEREFVFRQRNERLRKLEANWRENLSNLQSNLSEARTSSALEALGNTADWGVRPSALNHNY